MGLIAAAASVLGAAGAAVNTTAESMWVDYFESGDMSGGVLMKRGERISKKGAGKHGDQNIITSGSGIDVQENQCMILVENGRIVDFCAVPGRYTFDASKAPSLMSGENKGLKALASQFSQSFLAGGSRTNTQRVYYINLGEIQGFKWGSGNIVFDHWETDMNTGKPCWHIATTLMGNGMYSIQITDPAKFFAVIGAQKTGSDGNGLITRADIEPQIKTEAIAAIRQGVGQLSKLHIGYTEIAANEAKLTEDVDQILDKSWSEARGISIFRIAIGGDEGLHRPIDARRLYGHGPDTGHAGGRRECKRRGERLCRHGDDERHGRHEHLGPHAAGTGRKRSIAGAAAAAGRQYVDVLMRSRKHGKFLHELRGKETGGAEKGVLPELRLSVPGCGKSAEVLPELRDKARLKQL